MTTSIKSINIQSFVSSTPLKKEFLFCLIKSISLTEVDFIWVFDVPVQIINNSAKFDLSLMSMTDTS